MMEIAFVDRNRKYIIMHILKLLLYGVLLNNMGHGLGENAKSYLELFTSFNQVSRDASDSVVADVQHAEELQLVELVRGKHRVEAVAQQVVVEVDLLQRVLHPVEQARGQPAHRVLGEVHNLRQTQHSTLHAVKRRKEQLRSATVPL